MLRPGYALSRLQAASLFGSRKQHSGLKQRMETPMPPGNSLRIPLTGLKLAAGSLPYPLSRDQLICFIQASFHLQPQPRLASMPGVIGLLVGMGPLASTPMSTIMVTLFMTISETNAPTTIPTRSVVMIQLNTIQLKCAVSAVVTLRKILGSQVVH